LRCRPQRLICCWICKKLLLFFCNVSLFEHKGLCTSKNIFCRASSRLSGRCVVYRSASQQRNFWSRKIYARINSLFNLCNRSNQVNIYLIPKPHLTGIIFEDHTFIFRSSFVHETFL
jgi:hypothetical protein